MQDHRRLRVWKHSHGLAVEVRQATRRFPRTGYSSIQSQMLRAAESIPFNIAEGCGANTKKEFARFLAIGIKSTSELESELELARDYGILPPDKWEELSENVIDARKMLCGLRKKILGSP